MNCPACGCENAPDAIYCDDCGAQIKPSCENEPAVKAPAEPLALDSLLDGQLKIVKVVHFDSLGGLYKAETVKDDEAPQDQLVAEWPDQHSENVWSLLQALTDSVLWCPQSKIKYAGRTFLAGLWPGCSLSNFLSEHSLDTDNIIDIGVQILNGLSLMHREGWTHNGISPDSIWLDNEQNVKIVGYERISRGSGEAEAERCIVPGFSAPEVYGLCGGVIDRRSDLYSVGALLYMLLTGHSVNLEESGSSFAFPTTMAVKLKPLIKVIQKAVKREPNDRFISASEMRQALTAAGERLKANQAEPDNGVCGGQVVGEYTVAKKSHIGMVRRVNQDAFLELTLSACERDRQTQAHFVGVIDGMGGEAEGDKAASLAVRAIAHELTECFLPLKFGGETNILLPDDPALRNAVILERAVKRANASIFKYASENASRRGMGCTISCVLLEGDQATFAHVGDTRGYRFNQELDQVTTDHSMVGQLVQSGALTKEEARHSPHRSVIYRAVGTQAQLDVDIYQRTIAKGEYIMLSSDGVWEYYTDEELLAFFKENLSPQEICERLVNTCLSRGADDNCTTAIIRRCLQ